MRSGNHPVGFVNGLEDMLPFVKTAGKAGVDVVEESQELLMPVPSCSPQLLLDIEVNINDKANNEAVGCIPSDIIVC